MITKITIRQSSVNSYVPNRVGYDHRDIKDIVPDLESASRYYARLERLCKALQEHAFPDDMSGCLDIVINLFKKHMDVEPSHTKYSKRKYSVSRGDITIWIETKE